MRSIEKAGGVLGNTRLLWVRRVVRGRVFIRSISPSSSHPFPLLLQAHPVGRMNEDVECHGLSLARAACGPTRARLVVTSGEIGDGEVG